MHFLFLYFSRRVLPLVLLPILLSSCTEEKKEDKLPNYQSDIVKTSNALGITWLKEQFEKSPGENICIAPFPLVMMSSVLACGADGETRDQLWKFAANSLCINGNLPDNFNEASYLSHIKQLNDQIKKDIPEYLIYNRLYVNKNVDFTSAYKKNLQKNLNININYANFSQNPDKLVEKINHEITNSTNGLVQHCLPLNAISPGTSYLMFNVLGYFGKWMTPFETELTKKDQFYLYEDSKKVEIPFMNAKGLRSFRETDSYTLFWLSYTQSSARFVAILPSKNVGIKKIIHNMGRNTPNEYLTLMNSSQKNYKNNNDKAKELFLPKFEFSTPIYDCNFIFEKQGITHYFEQEKTTFYNNNIFQKNYMKINEEGTIAYSLTAEKPHSDEVFQDTKEIRVNRPFLFFIIDNKTKLILFLSIICNPNNNNKAIN